MFKILNVFDRLYDKEILSKIDFLKTIRLFEGIRNRDIIHILENLQERTYLKGETIFAQGDIGRALFIVFSGKIALTRLDNKADKPMTVPAQGPMDPQTAKPMAAPSQWPTDLKPAKPMAVPSQWPTDLKTAKSELIAEVRPGEFFGEMALLEEMPRTATAYAMEETRVFMLFKIKLESLLFSRPKIGVVISTQLAEIMSARLRGYMEKGAL